jgi:uncharacterized protein YggE
MDAGANEVDGVQFTVENKNALRAKAREEAARVASDKADQLAKLLGGKKGRPVSITDVAVQTYYPWAGERYAANAQIAMDAPRGEAKTDPESAFSSGSVSVEVRIEVVYALD